MTDPTRTERRRLMAERDAAVKDRDWARMNDLTRQLTELPMHGVRPLTQKDIDRYRKAHGGA